MRISDWSSDVCSSDLADLDIREEFFHRSRTFTFQNGELVAARQKRGGELQSPLFAARCGGAQPSRQRGYVGTHKARSEEHTSELQSLMRISYAVFCLKKKNNIHKTNTPTHQ